MSKSMGNTVDPQTVTTKMGAEIVRLWVAATDYSGDLNIDDKILARVVDTYRRVRNTLKFLLANVSDFDPAKDSVASDQLLEIDRYALSRLSELQSEVLAHYEVYEFHPVVAKLQIYCSEDLGSFYLDILKDLLYGRFQSNVPVFRSGSLPMPRRSKFAIRFPERFPFPICRLQE